MNLTDATHGFDHAGPTLLFSVLLCLGSVVDARAQQSTTRGWVFGFDLGGAAVSFQNEPSDRGPLVGARLGYGVNRIVTLYMDAYEGDVLRFLSKKNDVWFPKLKPVPVMGTEKENHTSWERYYRVSDCSSSSRNNWYLWR